MVKSGLFKNGRAPLADAPPLWRNTRMMASSRGWTQARDTREVRLAECRGVRSRRSCCGVSSPSVGFLTIAWCSARKRKGARGDARVRTRVMLARPCPATSSRVTSAGVVTMLTVVRLFQHAGPLSRPFPCALQGQPISPPDARPYGTYSRIRPRSRKPTARYTRSAIGVDCRLAVWHPRASASCSWRADSAVPSPRRRARSSVSTL